MYVEKPPFVFCVGADTEVVFTETVPAQRGDPAHTVHMAHSEAALFTAFARFVARSDVQLMLAFNAAFDLGYFCKRSCLMEYMSTNPYKRVRLNWAAARRDMERWRALQGRRPCACAGSCECAVMQRKALRDLFQGSDGGVPPIRVRVLSRIPDEAALARTFAIMRAGGAPSFVEELTRLRHVPARVKFVRNARGGDDVTVESPGYWWGCAMQFGESLPNKGGASAQQPERVCPCVRRADKS